MSHIDEGVLHAHLDGALRPGHADWATAEAHLDVCHDCRRRLAEARELRDGAATLLAGMSTKPLPQPSFQELAAAGAARRLDLSPPPVTAPPRRRGPRWWNSPGRLAWAASLVLAVGAGWIGRQLAVEEGLDIPRAASISGGEAFEQEVPPGADEGAATPSEETDARSNVAGYRLDPTAQANEARRAEEAAPIDLLRTESELQKQAAADQSDADNRDAGLDDAPEATAASPQRRLAEEAAEPATGQERGQLAAQVVAKSESGALCYMAVVGGARESGVRARDAIAADRVEAPDEAQAVERIRLGADRTAGALVGGVAYVGYWADVGEDSIDVRLTDGERQLALNLRPEGSAMYGTLTRAAAGRADAADANMEGEAAAADGEIGGGRPITLEAAACPTDP